MEGSGTLKGDADEDSDDGDIEAQIQKELAGLQPRKDKKRPFEATQLEMPCGAFETLPHASRIPTSPLGTLLLIPDSNICATR